MANELSEIVNRETNAPKDSATEKTNPVIESLLPLLRTYTMWLAARRRDIIDAAEALGTVVPDMIKALAKVFTLLCTDTYTQENLATCPYMLHEDSETRGLLPLSPNQVPEACRSYVGEDGAVKPHAGSEEEGLEPFQETLARILDVLRCAYFLAEDAMFPLAYDVADKGLVFDYRVPVQKDVPMEQAEPRIMSNPLVQAAQEPEPRPNPYRLTRPVSRHVDDSNLVPSKPAYAVPERQEAIPEADDAETTVINMLAPFLKPPTPQQNSRSHDEASYGMHSTTANEVFGMLPPESSPTGSFPSKKFEPLPWDWVYTPTPHKPGGSSPSMTKEAFDGSVSPGRAPKEFGRLSGSNVDDPFVGPERPFAADLSPAPAAANGVMGSPRVVSAAAEEAHRQSLLQSFGGSSAPRTSAFSHWGQNSSMVPKETVPPSWGGHHHQAFNGHVPSSASVFSHPSSLYQGTPAAGAVFGMAPPGLPVSGHYVANQASSGQEHPSSAPHFQMDDTTSSYDAAILQAAFYGNK